MPSPIVQLNTSVHRDTCLRGLTSAVAVLVKGNLKKIIDTAPNRELIHIRNTSSARYGRDAALAAALICAAEVRKETSTAGRVAG